MSQRVQESENDSEDSDDGSEFMRSRRKCKRWLHAGVTRDPKGGTVQMWFGFSHFLHEDAYTQAPIDQRGWKIHWAVSNKGKLSGNRGVGQLQRNLITFNPHISRHWKKHLANNGQWEKKQATKGRQCQYNTLRKFWKSQTYVDPYPNGNQNLLVGPSLNVIHPRGGVNDGPPYHELLINAPCYPNTRIPLNPRLIKFNLFEDWNGKALTVIEDFLRGKMASGPDDVADFDVVQADRIESAFFHCGWRVDRKAVRKANKHVTQKVVKLANNSRSWRRHQPIRVDDHQKHCQRVQDLMDRLRDRHHEPHNYNGDDSSDDDDDDNDAWERGPRGPNHGQGENDISSDEDEDDDGAPAPGSSRIKASQSLQRGVISRERTAKAATSKGVKKNGGRKQPRKSKKVAKEKLKDRARANKSSQKAVVDLSSDSEEEREDDQILNENDDDDGYAIILEDSSSDGDDENENDSEAELASRLIRALGGDQTAASVRSQLEPREDEPLFVTDDDDDLVILDGPPEHSRPRLGGSAVNALREDYFAQNRVKQERSPPARELGTPSAVIKTSNSTPRDGSPIAGAIDERGPSEGFTGFLETIHAIGDMLLNDSPSPSASPEPQPENNTHFRLQRAASAEPPASQRTVFQKESNSEPLSPILGSGRRQPSAMNSPLTRKRISEDVEDAGEPLAKKAKPEPVFIWLKEESESQNNPIVISDDEEDDDEDIDLDEDQVVIIGDGSEDNPIFFD